MLNDLLYRFKSAFLAFRKPEVVNIGMDSEMLMKLDAYQELAIIKPLWISKNMLIPQIVMLTPEQSSQIRHYLDFGV